MSSIYKGETCIVFHKSYTKNTRLFTQVSSFKVELDYSSTWLQKLFSHTHFVLFTLIQNILSDAQ